MEEKFCKSKGKSYLKLKKAKEKLLWAHVHCCKLHDQHEKISQSGKNFYTGCGCSACEIRKSISDAIIILEN